MSLFVWMTLAMLGSFAVGVIAGVFLGLDHPRDETVLVRAVDVAVTGTEASLGSDHPSAVRILPPRPRPYDWERD